MPADIGLRYFFSLQPAAHSNHDNVVSHTHTSRPRPITQPNITRPFGYGGLHHTGKKFNNIGRVPEPNQTSRMNHVRSPFSRPFFVQTPGRQCCSSRGRGRVSEETVRPPHTSRLAHFTSGRCRPLDEVSSTAGCHSIGCCGQNICHVITHSCRQKKAIYPRHAAVPAQLVGAETLQQRREVGTSLRDVSYETKVRHFRTKTIRVLYGHCNKESNQKRWG